MHVKPLAQVFRAKFRAALCQTPLSTAVPVETWCQPWVVDCRPVGSGRTALQYLAPYIFRVALSNNRIVNVANEQVTFRYQDGETGQPRTCTLTAEEFIRRFLQHVLPKGFVKVRYFGLFSPGNRKLLALLRHLLVLAAPPPLTCQAAAPAAAPIMPPPSIRCPSCGTALQLIQILLPTGRSPPRQREH